jgi:hypothetical protein
MLYCSLLHSALLKNTGSTTIQSLTTVSNLHSTVFSLPRNSQFNQHTFTAAFQLVWFSVCEFHVGINTFESLTFVYVGMSYYTLPVEHVVLEESDKTMSLTEVQM